MAKVKVILRSEDDLHFKVVRGWGAKTPTTTHRLISESAVGWVKMFDPTLFKGFREFRDTVLYADQPRDEWRGTPSCPICGMKLTKPLLEPEVWLARAPDCRCGAISNGPEHDAMEILAHWTMWAEGIRGEPRFHRFEW